MIKLDISFLNKNIDFEKYRNLISEKHDILWNKKGPGNEMLGWLELPNNYSQQELENINKKAQELKELGVEALVVIGIGGSYLGVEAAVNFLKGSIETRDKLYYLGINVSTSYIKQIENKLKDKKWAICVISKSGTTLEPAISFHYFKNLLIKKVGEEESKKLIVAVTDEKKGVLKGLADKNGYASFTIPDNIGGRFSGVTPVGLFPLAFIGADIFKFIEGTKKAHNDLKNSDLLTNDAYKYALLRYLLYKEDKRVFEIFTTYDHDFMMFNEWMKQLFAESEGKDGKALFPTSVNYTKDLHSLGQIIQDGDKSKFFETTIFYKEKEELYIEETENDEDGLNYLSKQSFSLINKKILDAVLNAHGREAKIPNILFYIEGRDEVQLGYLYYFFFIVVSISGYLLEINPFNQPGVESYKKIMFYNLKH